jgi:hypothetical protein
VIDMTEAGSHEPAREIMSTVAENIHCAHCAHCGNPFATPRIGSARYCSNGCRQAAYRDRRLPSNSACEAVASLSSGRY